MRYAVSFCHLRICSDAMPVSQLVALTFRNIINVEMDELNQIDKIILTMWIIHAGKHWHSIKKTFSSVCLTLCPLPLESKASFSSYCWHYIYFSRFVASFVSKIKMSPSYIFVIFFVDAFAISQVCHFQKDTSGSALPSSSVAFVLFIFSFVGTFT